MAAKKALKAHKDLIAVGYFADKVALARNVSTKLDVPEMGITKLGMTAHTVTAFGISEAL